MVVLPRISGTSFLGGLGGAVIMHTNIGLTILISTEILLSVYVLTPNWHKLLPLGGIARPDFRFGLNAEQIGLTGKEATDCT